MHTFVASSVHAQAGLYGPYDGPYGIGTPVPYYAMSVQRYMYEYNVSAEQIANVPVILRENASKNPYAEFQKPITIEEVLNSRIISPPIHLLECSKFSDGAACVILASEDFAKKLNKKIVFITGIGEYHDCSHFIPSEEKSICEFIATKIAAKEAFSIAGRKPEDIDVAEIYGVFAGTELMIIEDIGFFKKGEAAKAAEQGLIKIGGKIPVDTSGGRLSMGHPATVTPLLEVIEIVKQLKGVAENRQVKDAKCGLIHAEHGMLNGSLVMILESLS
jgi:acetyl-CoA acetyltransferase